MTKYYFVRKVALTLTGDQQIHLLSLVTGVSFKARLDQPLTSKSVFPGMTYQASIVKRGRGLIVISLVPAGDVGFLECRVLASFVGTHNALPGTCRHPASGNCWKKLPRKSDALYDSSSTNAADTFSGNTSARPWQHSCSSRGRNTWPFKRL